MELSREDFDQAVVVHCSGRRLDALVALKFKDGFREFDGETPQRVVLDMSGIDFMDSSGLGAVVAVYKMLGPDCRFDLAALTPAVERVFKLTRMESVFNCYKDVQSALTVEQADAHPIAGG